jgi:MFS family permease
VAGLLLDLTPLRVEPAYRRLYAGFALSGVGAQLAATAIGLQVYDLSRSTAAVGLVGLCALVPLVVMGLYGGALVDHHDRRTVAIVGAVVLWAASIGNIVQSFLDNRHVWVLYLLAGVSSAAFGVVNPARAAIYPRLLAPELLPAANALSIVAMNLAFLGGPFLAGILVDLVGFTAAYALDAAMFTAAMWGLWRLPPIPPEHDGEPGTGPSRPPGLRAVWDGLAFLGTRPNVRMTFLADLVAMVLAQPRALLPAIAALVLGGGARTVGLLGTAVAVGGVVAMLASGPLGRIRRQGIAVVVSVIGWGAGFAAFGAIVLAVPERLDPGPALWWACAAMAVAGASDAVSAVFRVTILQAATPDHLRGRLQGVFVVVVAGGPRLGEMLSGAVASVLGEGRTAVLGGLACIGAIVALGVWQRGFLRYDSRHPTP